MANKKEKPLIKDERIEDNTMYGEFISSFNQWTTSENQKDNAKHLEEVSELNQPADVKRRAGDAVIEKKKDKKK